MIRVMRRVEGGDELYGLLCRQFNCRSHLGLAAVNDCYGNGSALGKTSLSKQMQD